MEINKTRSWKRRKSLFILLLPMLLFAVSALVMYLWNALLPDLLQVRKISYWQAMGLLVLCRILFGSFRMGARHGRATPAGAIGFKDKLMQMSPDERAAFKQQWKSRCAKP